MNTRRFRTGNCFVSALFEKKNVIYECLLLLLLSLDHTLLLLLGTEVQSDEERARDEHAHNDGQRRGTVVSDQLGRELGQGTRLFRRVGCKRRAHGHRCRSRSRGDRRRQARLCAHLHRLLHGHCHHEK